MRDFLRTRWRLILGVVLWAALITAILISWEDVRDDQAGLLFPVSVILIVLALVSGGMGWAFLQPGAIVSEMSRNGTWRRGSQPFLRLKAIPPPIDEPLKSSRQEIAEPPHSETRHYLFPIRARSVRG